MRTSLWIVFNTSHLGMSQKKIIPVQISKDMDLKKAGWSPTCHTWPTCFLNSLCVSERSSLFAYFKKNSMVLSWKRDEYRQLNHPIFWSLVELQNKTNKIITYDSYDVIISSPYIYIIYIYVHMLNICCRHWSPTPPPHKKKTHPGPKLEV